MQLAWVLETSVEVVCCRHVDYATVAAADCWGVGDRSRVLYDGYDKLANHTSNSTHSRGFVALSHFGDLLTG